MQIIRITATWCSSCLVMKKTFKKIEEEYPKFEFIDLDYDFDEEQIKNYNVGSILPLLIAIEDNKEVQRLAGEHSLKEVQLFLGDL